MGAAAWPCPFLMQWCQRIDDAHDEDVGSEDDDVHQQTDTKEIAETVAAITTIGLVPQTSRMLVASRSAMVNMVNTVTMVIQACMPKPKNIKVFIFS